MLKTKLIPNFFSKAPLSEITDQDLLQTIELLKKQPDAQAAMKLALEVLNKKYQSKRLSTYIFFYKAFEADPNKLWKRSGFMHCHQQNYLFRLLMIRSGKLNDDQIKLGFSLVWYISPHQYLKIKIGKQCYAIDPWNYGRGAEIGSYATGFSIKTLKSC